MKKPSRDPEQSLQSCHMKCASIADAIGQNGSYLKELLLAKDSKLRVIKRLSSLFNPQKAWPKSMLTHMSKLRVSGLPR